MYIKYNYDTTQRTHLKNIYDYKRHRIGTLFIVQSISHKKLSEYVFLNNHNKRNTWVSVLILSLHFLLLQPIDFLLFFFALGICILP